MADLLGQKKARALLEEQRWTCERGGKHVIKMTKPGERPITLPITRHRTMAKGFPRQSGGRQASRPEARKGWVPRFDPATFP